MHAYPWTTSKYAVGLGDGHFYSWNDPSGSKFWPVKVVDRQTLYLVKVILLLLLMYLFYKLTLIEICNQQNF